MENAGQDTLNCAHENVVEKLILTFKKYIVTKPHQTTTKFF